MVWLKRCSFIPVAALLAVTLSACSGHTDAATNVSDTTATLNARGSCDKACEAWFRYRQVGTSTWTQTAHIQIPNQVNNAPFSSAISGLTPNTAYEYQACGRENSWSANTYGCTGPDGGGA